RRRLWICEMAIAPTMNTPLSVVRFINLYGICCPRCQRANSTGEPMCIMTIGNLSMAERNRIFEDLFRPPANPSLQPVKRLRIKRLLTEPLVVVPLGHVVRSEAY